MGKYFNELTSAQSSAATALLKRNNLRVETIKTEQEILAQLIDERKRAGYYTGKQALFVPEIVYNNEIVDLILEPFYEKGYECTYSIENTTPQKTIQVNIFWYPTVEVI